MVGFPTGYIVEYKGISRKGKHRNFYYAKRPLEKSDSVLLCLQCFVWELSPTDLSLRCQERLNTLKRFNELEIKDNRFLSDVEDGASEGTSGLH